MNRLQEPGPWRVLEGAPIDEVRSLMRSRLTGSPSDTARRVGARLRT